MTEIKPYFILALKGIVDPEIKILSITLTHVGFNDKLNIWKMLIGQLLCYANYARLYGCILLFAFMVSAIQDCDSFMGHDSPVVDRWTKQYLLNVIAFISCLFSSS